MSEAKLFLKPTNLGHGLLKEDYTVRDEHGTVIGRIYFAREVAHGPRWFWSNLRHPNRPTDRGRADDLAAAKIAFKAAWEKP